MYLLIRTPVGSSKKDCLHLHPTMYLLIHSGDLVNNVIINYLHPTMYLLIRKAYCKHGGLYLIYIPLCIY